MTGQALDEKVGTTLELLAELATGATVSDAARRSGLSTPTARRRLADLRSHWHCPNNLALVATAVRRDLV